MFKNSQKTKNFEIKLNPFKTGNFQRKKERFIVVFLTTFSKNIRVRFSIGNFIKREDKCKKIVDLSTVNWRQIRKKIVHETSVFLPKNEEQN